MSVYDSISVIHNLSYNNFQLWSTSHKRQDVVPALKESLKSLGMDYVDLFLVHWPISMPVGSIS